MPKTHQMCGTPEHNAWRNMKARCSNPKHKDYERYGGRGICVCNSWLESFGSFFTDMGNRPSTNHSLERRDNNSGYSAENCYWAEIADQANNRRSNNLITYNGETKTLMMWSKDIGIKYSTLRARIFTYGWSVEKAFSL